MVGAFVGGWWRLWRLWRLSVYWLVTVATALLSRVTVSVTVYISGLLNEPCGMCSTRSGLYT